jgi:hypothetical protein
MHSYSVLRETPQSRALFVRIVTALSIGPTNAPLRGLLVRALDEAWSAPSVPGAAVHRSDPARPGARSDRPRPPRLAARAADLPGEHLDDPLLLTLMSVTVVVQRGDREIPLGPPLRAARGRRHAARVRQRARAAMLHQRICLCVVSSDEARGLRSRATGSTRRSPRERLCRRSGLRQSRPIFPLSDLANAKRLLARPWPRNDRGRADPADPRAARRSRAARTTSAQLTPIEDDVSRAVRAQYEANPYPRWVRTALAAAPTPSVAAFRRESVSFRDVPCTARAAALDILIAGCGTGQHAVMTRGNTTGRAPSRSTSAGPALAYAAARTRALGLAIDYAQGRHHAPRHARPQLRPDRVETACCTTWPTRGPDGACCSALLRPDGFMRIGLYSEIARGAWSRRAPSSRSTGYGATAAEIRPLPLRDDAARRRDGAQHRLVQ